MNISKILTKSSLYSRNYFYNHSEDDGFYMPNYINKINVNQRSKISINVQVNISTKRKSYFINQVYCFLMNYESIPRLNDGILY
jgi:hypothetical protein